MRIIFKSKKFKNKKKHKKYIKVNAYRAIEMREKNVNLAAFHL